MEDWILSQFDEEGYWEDVRADAREEGLAEGIFQGRLDSIALMLGSFSEADVKKALKATDEEIAKAKEQLADCAS